MASGVRNTVQGQGMAFQAGVAALDAMSRIRRLGLSPRQQELNHFWSIYTCHVYADRKIDWDGTPHLKGAEHGQAASAGYTMANSYFEVTGTTAVPLKLRRPTAPYYLCRVITNRFTGILFAENKHPQVQCIGDEDSEDWLAAAIEQGRLWAHMIMARRYGGATGTGIIGFGFIDGRVRFETLDPRWCTPMFLDTATFEMAELEVRYQFPKEERQRDGSWKDVAYWYRRLITTQSDIIWSPVAVGDGEEPAWDALPQREIVHGFGFVPFVWVQNEEVHDSIDGNPDCDAIFESSEAIDALVAQANRGTLANCDPTLVLSTKDKIGDLKKGSGNAIKLDGSAAYLEQTGSGGKAAIELAEKLRTWALEVTQCVLDHPDVANRTATEVERAYSSMHERAGEFREQYGQRGVLPLLEKLLRGARTITTPTVEDVPAAQAAAQAANVGRPRVVERQIFLPPKPVEDEDGKIVKLQPRVLGKGGEIRLKWPPFFTPTPDDATKIATAANTARTAKIISEETAVRYVAATFGVENPAIELKRIREEEEAKQARLDEMAMASGFNAAGQGAGGGKPFGGGAGGGTGSGGAGTGGNKADAADDFDVDDDGEK